MLSARFGTVFSTLHDVSNYNFIYHQLVKAPTDVVGALAYTLYKNEKVDYIAKFTEKHGKPPTDDDLAHFHLTSTTSSRVAAYQQSAEVLLNNFLTEVLADAIEQHQQQVEQSIQMRAIRRTQTNLSQKIDTKHSFWRGVGQNVIAGAVSSAMTFGIIFVSWLLTVGPGNMAWDILDYVRGHGEGKRAESPSTGHPEPTPTGLNE